MNGALAGLGCAWPNPLLTLESQRTLLSAIPRAHFELVGLVRYQFIGPSTVSEASASLYMLQLHYYL